MDAAVTCRQLGRSGSGKYTAAHIMPVLSIHDNLVGATARPNAAFGQGNGPVFLTDVTCNGLEERLLDCMMGDIESNNCGHHQDAGVVCLAGYYYM